MRIALISDIHANVVALETALTAIQAHHPDRIISLGDQINLGPCPRKTIALLREAGVTCLHGNHERYVRSAMHGDPAYSGANFASLHFNARRLREDEITWPETLQIAHLTLCHALPGDDRFPINEPDKAIPRLRAMTWPAGTHILCGHGHNPTHYRLPNVWIDSIGSAGCMDDGAPHTTTYTLVELHGDAVALRPMMVGYDPTALFPLFKSSGMADECPIMARLIYWQMVQNSDHLLRFLAIAREKHPSAEEPMPLSAWQAADAAYAWPDAHSTAEFWRLQTPPTV